MLHYLDYAFTQRAIVELVLLAAVAGAIGPWIVMRSLSFFAHAVGTAAFPGLVIAASAGLAQPIGAAAGAAAVAIGAGLANPSTRNPARTGLWLSGCLAVGAIAAGSLGTGGASLDSALFGSLLTLSTIDLALAGCTAVAAVAVAALAGRRWMAAGMLQRRGSAWEVALVLLVAAAAISQLAAAGALLASALLVLPAAAARPWVRSVARWQLATGATALATGLTGLTLALGMDLPPGAAIAIVAGICVAVSLAAAALRARSGLPALPAALTALLAAGCGAGPAGQAGKPEVVATTPIVASLAKSVAGPDARVTTMVPPGTDPHDFEPKPSDLAAIADSGLIIASGGLDGWVRELGRRAGNDTAILELLKRVPVKLRGSGDAGGGGEIDPHWFHDPRNAIAATAAIASALGKLDPRRRADYDARASAFAKSTRELDSRGRACIARLPQGQRSLVTDHDAFGYLANRTGLEIVGAVIPSTSSSAAPSARQLEDLASRIESLKIRAIFPESALDPKLAKALAARTGTRVAPRLNADTLGKPGSGTDTWAGMWAGNVETIVAALSGGSIACRLGAGR